MMMKMKKIIHSYKFGERKIPSLKVTLNGITILHIGLKR